MNYQTLFFLELGKMSQNLSSTAVVIGALRVNSFLASGDFCHLMIIFADSLDPDQDRRCVGPNLDPNRLTP